MEFFRQEYWSGLTFLLPGDLPDPGIEPAPPVSLPLAGGFFLPLCHLRSRAAQDVTHPLKSYKAISSYI